MLKSAVSLLDPLQLTPDERPFSPGRRPLPCPLLPQLPKPLAPVTLCPPCPPPFTPALPHARSLPRQGSGWAGEWLYRKKYRNRPEVAASLATVASGSAGGAGGGASGPAGIGAEGSGEALEARVLRQGC
jgi:hypothetical protein